MKRRSLSVVCILVTFPISPAVIQTKAESFYGSFIQQNRNAINGYIFDQQRRPVTEVFVELQNEVNSPIARTKTNGSGRYYFGNLSAGRFTVRVLPYGTNLEEQSQEVEIINFVAPGSNTSESAQKDFYLRVRKDGNGVSPVTGTVFIQEVPAEAKKKYEKAVVDFGEKRVEIGIEELQSAVKLFPTYYLALERLGREYINQQKYEFARENFAKAVVVNARSYNGWYGLGYASYALKQSEAAVEAAEKAVSLNPNSVDALLFLGISKRQAKRYDEAEKSLKQAEKMSQGKNPDVHWNLALLYAHNLKRYKEAATELELYLVAKPNDPNVDNIRKLIKQFREKSSSF
jgi:tetratricopeptide (TPR) repeat protein